MVWLVTMTVSLIWIGYFLLANDAPITNGHIEYGVPYKSDQKLDIYYPTQQIFEKSPVILFVHGGAWIMGRKESINVNRINGAINQLRENGYTIISPDYTLARHGNSPFPDCILDGFDAIEWISQNADSLNLDMSNLGFIGESAGAHIAMMLAFANPEDFGFNYPKSSPMYIVDIYGPADLYGLYQWQTSESTNSMMSKVPRSVKESLDLPKLLFGFDPNSEPEQIAPFTRKYSPTTYLSQDIPTVLMIHGDADQIVPISQSTFLKSKLDSLGVPNQLIVVPGVKHAFRSATDQQKSDIQVWIADFIQSQYVTK